METSEEFLKQLATQLSCPEGELGTEVADRMHLNNIGMTRSAIQALPLAENSRVLEIGHGSGMHIPELFALQENTTFYGLERSWLMHQTAQKANEHLVKQKKAVFTFSESDTFPFENDFFNAVYTVNTLYFWENPINFLNEIHRILKPGGEIAICFSTKQFMKTLPFTDFGFNLYDVEDFKNVVLQSQLRWKKHREFIEKVQSNAGEKVEREYVVAICKKED